MHIEQVKSCITFSTKTYSELPHDKTNKMASVPCKDSDQPPVFTVHMKKAQVLSYPLSTQWRLWSDWVYAQADLCLCWGHISFCWFCNEAALLVRVMHSGGSSLLATSFRSMFYVLSVTIITLYTNIILPIFSTFFVLKCATEILKISSQIKIWYIFW